jgi:Kdo2-lipid IVA lauroyltransferase/acyltransferase
MYYLVYGLLKLISFVPLRLLYGVSSFLAWLLFSVIKYRKPVVFKNLNNAFPNKSPQEINKIAKQFYLNFTDSFIEVIKALSKGKAWVERRAIIDISVLEEILNRYPNAQLLAGHQFNWELLNLAMKLQHPKELVAVYMPIGNKHLEKVFFNLRSRYGTKMIPATDMKNTYLPFRNVPHTLVLVADQNPGVPSTAHWVHFFNKLIPFVKGPETGAKTKNAPVIYPVITKVKRGQYKMSFEVMMENPNDYENGQITKLFAQRLQQSITAQPDMYLWSHKRWKYEYNEQYADLVIQ